MILDIYAENKPCCDNCTDPAAFNIFFDKTNTKVNLCLRCGECLSDMLNEEDDD